MGRNIKKAKCLFFNDVKEYLKLLYGNYHHLRELVQFVETIKVNYNKVSKNLITRKSELFRKQDISGWQLSPNDINKINEFYSDRLASYKKICFKDTNNVIEIKKKYGYHLNKMINEYQRLRTINTIENKEKVIQFSKKQSQISSDYLKIMGEIIDIMEACTEKSKNEETNTGESVPPPSDNNEIENNLEKKDEIEENQNKINTEVYEDKKEEIVIDEKKEEFKNEIKEEKIEEKNNGEKILEKKEEEKKKEEENKEEKTLEKKEEEKIEEKNEEKNEEKVDEKINEEKNNEDKKEEIENKKNDISEEKNEQKKEEIPEENKEEEK